MKIKTLILFITLLFLSVFANKSYAQGYKSIGYFDSSTPFYQQDLTLKENSERNTRVEIFPITNITIRQGSFNQNVHIKVFKGKWDLLTAGPNKNTSPVSAFYIAFLSSQGEELRPNKIIDVYVYNNYPGTKATYTPISRDTGLPDISNQHVFPNQAFVKAFLPQNDGGFIVAIDKKLDKNDPSLNPKIIGPAQVSPTPVPSASAQAKKGLLEENGFLIFLAVTMATMMIGIIIFIVKYNKEERP